MYCWQVEICHVVEKIYIVKITGFFFSDHKCQQFSNNSQNFVGTQNADHSHIILRIFSEHKMPTILRVFLEFSRNTKCRPFSNVFQNFNWTLVLIRYHSQFSSDIHTHTESYLSTQQCGSTSIMAIANFYFYLEFCRNTKGRPFSNNSQNFPVIFSEHKIFLEFSQTFNGAQVPICYHS